MRLAMAKSPVKKTKKKETAAAKAKPGAKKPTKKAAKKPEEKEESTGPAKDVEITDDLAIDKSSKRSKVRR